MSAAAPVGANEESFRRVWMSKPIARIATTGCSLLPAFAFFLASLSMPVCAQTIFDTSSPDPGKPSVAMIAPPEPAVPAAVVRQPEEQSEFQMFVSASLGKELPLYGHDLSVDAPDTFSPLENIPVTADYVIGPGDELQIHGWGQVD